jgi:hypothetical protein
MKFIQENYIYITILSIIIIGSLVIFSIFKDKFTNIPPYIEDNQKKKVINIETFNNNSKNMAAAFCKKYQPTPHLLKSHCKNLGIKGCHIPKCCVLLDGKKCVPGDQNGPTFRTHNGKQVLVNYFEHQNKCTSVNGKCPN